MSEIQKRFTRIYDINHWGSKETRSGHGSTVAYNRKLISVLPMVFATLGIQTFLDIGCGDCNWIKLVNWKNVDYTGVDIVPALVEHNRKTWGESHRRRFLHMNAITDELPSNIDMAFCKDVLIHLPHHLIFELVNNLKKARVKYLMASTCALDEQLPDIKVADFRLIDLTLPPISFGEPIYSIPWNKQSSFKIWRVEDLPSTPST